MSDGAEPRPAPLPAAGAGELLQQRPATPYPNPPPHKQINNLLKSGEPAVVEIWDVRQHAWIKKYMVIGNTMNLPIESFNLYLFIDEGKSKSGNVDDATIIENNPIFIIDGSNKTGFNIYSTKTDIYFQCHVDENVRNELEAFNPKKHDLTTDNIYSLDIGRKTPEEDAALTHIHLHHVQQNSKVDVITLILPLSICQDPFGF